MTTSQVHPAVAEAATLFDRHEKRRDGLKIAQSLASGLNQLRESLLQRVLESEQEMPKDSMLLPSSLVKAQQMAAEEVEAFLIAESAAAVGQFGYVDEVEPWYIPWLTHMRLDSWNPLSDVPGRVGEYLKESPSQRRLQFSDMLVHALPATRRAPLVLFRLLPVAAQIVTVRAFGDPKTAEKLRREQIKVHPAIGYCKQCQGKLLDEGKSCPACGNPLWTHDWLCTVD